MLARENAELAPYLDKEVILKLLRSQIDKDLLTYGLECNWPEKDLLSAEEILQTLTHVMAFLLEKDRGRLMQFIYRVDIPEERLSAVLNEESGGNMDSRIANLVFVRELQKVVIRHKYSS